MKSSLGHQNVRPQAPALCHWILFLVGAALYLPILVMALGAFQVQDSMGVIHWGFDHYIGLFSNENLIGALGRSFWTAAITGLISAALGLGAALALEAKKTLMLSMLLTLAMVMPELVFALTLLSWFAWLGVGLSLTTVVIAHVTFSVSFSFLIYQARLNQIDPKLMEAALDLGASPLRALLKVKIPLLGPAMLGAFLVSFILSFDDFLISYFVNGVGADTLPIKLYTSMKTGVSQQQTALASLMALFSGGVLVVLTRTGILRKSA
jgi:spermidine/putrescine transport system permease protein